MVFHLKLGSGLLQDGKYVELVMLGQLLLNAKLGLATELPNKLQFFRNRLIN